VHDALLANAHPEIANDPRALNYLSDRYVQMREVGWPQVMQIARNSGSAEDLIRSVSSYDHANVRSHFQSYLADQPNNVQGLHNRIAMRERLSLNPAAPTTGGGNLPANGTSFPTAAASSTIAPGPALSIRQPSRMASPADTLSALNSLLAITNQNQPSQQATQKTGLAGLYPQPPQQSVLTSDPLSALKVIAPLLRISQNA
jgi:hypothetical protein